MRMPVEHAGQRGAGRGAIAGPPVGLRDAHEKIRFAAAGERLIVEQGATRHLDVAGPVRRIGEVEEGGGFRGQRLRRLAQRALGAGRVRRHQSRAAEQHQRRARRVHRDRVLQRFNGLAERDAIAAGGRDVEPDLARRQVGARIVRVEVRGDAQHPDCARHLAGIRVRKREPHLPGGARVGEQEIFQLLDLFGPSSHQTVDLRQLFARRQQIRRHRQRPLECRLRAREVVHRPQAHAEQIVRLGKPAVGLDGVAQRFGGVPMLAAEMPREPQLVEHPGPIVQRDVGRVVPGRGIVLLARGGDVAEQFEGARLRRIEGLRLFEIRRRGVELAAPPMGVPSFEVGDHGVRLERHGIGQGRDRRRRIPPGQRGVAVHDPLAVLPLPAGHPVGVGDRQNRQERDRRQDRALHAQHPSAKSAGRELSRFPGF